MKFLFLILTTTSLLFSSDLYTDKIEYIAKQKTWLKLLHYNNGKSSILNKDFFLSKEGKNNPLLELEQTLESFKNNKLICKYPARYIWLSEHFDFLDKNIVSDKCNNLKKWNILKDTASVSIVFVSGFLGNPASAFGHSFIKMNKLGNNKDYDLFDITISYGARLPEKNNLFLYIVNGLTGGYQASYSDKYFYMDNMVYSNREFREMWEHQLNLTDKQKQLLIYHLWELRGVRFDYYFLNGNCGYKISELFDVIYPESMIDSASLWYAPIETFHKLEELEKNSTKKVVSNINYYPSKQQVIYALFDGLTPKEQDIIVKIMKNDLKTIPLNYDDIDILSKVKIMDFLIEFQKYNSDAIDSSSLLQRMKLPILKYKKNKPKNKSAVTTSNKLSSFGIGLNNYKNKNYLQINFSTFLIDKIGFNNLDGDMLSIGEGEVSIMDNQVKLKKFDFIKIRRLKINTLPFDKENPISWSLSISMLDENERDFFIDGGIGYSWSFLDRYKYYMMLNSSLHTKKENIQIRPNIGLFANFDTLRVNLELSLLRDKNLKEINNFYHNFELQYHYKKDKSLYISTDNKVEDSLKLGLKWFF